MRDGRKSGDTADWRYALGSASLWDFLSEKKVPTKETRMKIKMEVNSILIFDYNMISLGDTADWKSEQTGSVVGWDDTATTVSQVVCAST